MARRKEIYEARWPETKKDARGGHAKAAKSATGMMPVAPSFTTDTASKTDRSVYTARRHVAIGEGLTHMAEEVAATPIADNQKELLALAKLAKKEQREVVADLASGKDWADKSAALASYAKQADDDELDNFAVRVKARAIRRCGELLQAIEKKHGANQNISTVSGTNVTRTSVAEDAGLSKHQKDTALRVASLPATDFNEAIESAAPPTITALAEQGLSLHPFVACNFGVSQNAA